MAETNESLNIGIGLQDYVTPTMQRMATETNRLKNSMTQLATAASKIGDTSGLQVMSARIDQAAMSVYRLNESFMSMGSGSRVVSLSTKISQPPSFSMPTLPELVIPVTLSDGLNSSFKTGSKAGFGTAASTLDMTKGVRQSQVVEQSIVRMNGAVQSSAQTMKNLIASLPDGIPMAMRSQIIQDEMANSISIPSVEGNIMANAQQINRRIQNRPLGRQSRRDAELGRVREPSFRLEPLTARQLAANNPTKEISVRQPYITSSPTLRSGNMTMDTRQQANMYSSQILPLVPSGALNKPLYDNGSLQETLRLTGDVQSTVSRITKASGETYDVMNNLPKAATDLSYGFKDASGVLNAMPSVMQKMNTEQRSMLDGVKQWASNLKEIEFSFKSMLNYAIGGVSIRDIMNSSDIVAAAPVRMQLAVESMPNYDMSQLPANGLAEMDAAIYAMSMETGTRYQDNLDTFNRIGILSGSAFDSPKALMGFLENLNKVYINGMSTQSQQERSLYQLTQALGSNTLQGNDFRAVREQSPLVLTTIQEYFTSKGVTENIRDLSAAGRITADEIVSAFEWAGENIDKVFERMPMTWTRVFSKVENIALKYSKPLLNVFGWLANNIEPYIPVIIGLSGAIMGYNLAMVVASGATKAYALVMGLATLAASSLGTAKLVLAGHSLAESIAIQNTTRKNYENTISIGANVTAMNTKNLSLQTESALLGATTNALNTKTVALGANTTALGVGAGAAKVATGAFGGFNIMLGTTLALVSGVALVIGLVVGVVYAATWAWNKMTGQAVSGTGLILGVLNVLFFTIWNSFVWLVNKVWGTLQWIANGLTGIGDFVELFFTTLWNGILQGLDAVGQGVNDVIWQITSLGGRTKGIDLGLGVRLDDDIDWSASRVNSLQDLLAEKMAGKQAVDWNALDYAYEGDLGKMYNAGYDFGVGIDKMFSTETQPDLSGLGSTLDLGGVGTDVSDIANNTGQIRDAVQLQETDLRHLISLAEREAVNRYTTANIIVRQNNNNTIHENADVDGFLARMTKDLAESIANSSAGVHE